MFCSANFSTMIKTAIFPDSYKSGESMIIYTMLKIKNYASEPSIYSFEILRSASTPST